MSSPGQRHPAVPGSRTILSAHHWEIPWTETPATLCVCHLDSFRLEHVVAVPHDTRTDFYQSHRGCVVGRHQRPPMIRDGHPAPHFCSEEGKVRVPSIEVG